jgi:hypothetical protein
MVASWRKVHQWNDILSLSYLYEQQMDEFTYDSHLELHNAK